MKNYPDKGPDFYSEFKEDPATYIYNPSKIFVWQLDQIHFLFNVSKQFTAIKKAPKRRLFNLGLSNKMNGKLKISKNGLVSLSFFFQ